MSYDGIFIAKVGVALDIPLCERLTTLMTIHLLYDCYIHYWQLNYTWHDSTLQWTCTHVNTMAWSSQTRNHFDLDNYRSPISQHTHANKK